MERALLNDVTARRSVQSATESVAALRQEGTSVQELALQPASTRLSQFCTGYPEEDVRLVGSGRPGCNPVATFNGQIAKPADLALDNAAVMVTHVTTVQHIMTGLLATETEDGRFRVMIEACLRFRNEKVRAHPRCPCSTLCTTLHLAPLFSSEVRQRVRRTQVSCCTSQSGQELKQDSIPRRHGSAEGAGRNAATAIASICSAYRLLLLVSYLAYSSTLKMEAKSFSETSLFLRTAQHYNPGEPFLF
jgi:hypothetical protein